MVQKAVEDRGGDGVVVEDLAPGPGGDARRLRRASAGSRSSIISRRYEHGSIILTTNRGMASAGGGRDLDVQLAEAGRHGHGLADQAGRDAVVVALERNERGTTDDPMYLKLRGERERRQGEQALPAGELGDRQAAARASVGDRDSPAIEVRLGLAERRDGRCSPPRSGDVLDRLLNDALALRPARRANPHLDAVVLGGLRERTAPPGRYAAGVAHRSDGDRRCPGQRPHHGTAIDRLDEMRERHALADHRPAAPGEGQRSDQDVRRFAPRRLAQLQPIPLNLITGLVLKLDGHAVPAGPTRLATRAQPEQPQLTHERHIRTIEPELDDLPVKDRPVDVCVIDEPRDQVVAKRLQAGWAPPRATAAGPSDSDARSCGHGRCAARSRTPTNPSAPTRGSPHRPPQSASPPGPPSRSQASRTSDPGGGPRQNPRAATRCAPALRAYAPRATARWTSTWGILAIGSEEDFAISSTGARQVRTPARESRRHELWGATSSGSSSRAEMSGWPQLPEGRRHQPQRLPSDLGHPANRRRMRHRRDSWTLRPG